MKPYDSNTMLKKHPKIQNGDSFTDGDFTFTKQDPEKIITSTLAIFSNINGISKFRYKGGVRNTLKRSRPRVHAPKRKSLRSSRRTLATDRA